MAATDPVHVKDKAKPLADAGLAALQHLYQLCHHTVEASGLSNELERIEVDVEAAKEKLNALENSFDEIRERCQTLEMEATKISEEERELHAELETQREKHSVLASRAARAKELYDSLQPAKSTWEVERGVPGESLPTWIDEKQRRADELQVMDGMV